MILRLVFAALGATWVFWQIPFSSTAEIKLPEVTAFSAFPDSIPPQDVEERLKLYEAMLSKIPKEELNPKSEEPSLRTPDQKFSYGLYDSIVALDASQRQLRERPNSPLIDFERKEKDQTRMQKSSEGAIELRRR